MAVYCVKENCIHRSTRKSIKTLSTGEPLYKCRLKDIYIQYIFDSDGDTRALFGETCMECAFYTKMDNEKVEV